MPDHNDDALDRAADQLADHIFDGHDDLAAACVVYLSAYRDHHGSVVRRLNLLNAAAILLAEPVERRHHDDDCGCTFCFHRHHVRAHFRADL